MQIETVFTATTTNAAEQDNLFELDASQFRDNFNRQPFLITHHLNHHPLFSLPELIELSKRMPAEDVSYNVGDVSVGQGLYKCPQNGLSIQETIAQIENCHSWMVIKRVSKDPQYRELLHACLDEIGKCSEPVEGGMCAREGFIFISSPGSVTPYHMDPEYNFLLQIRGEKTINIFDPADRAMLSEIELEDFYASDETANLTYKDEYQQKAQQFDLTPGLGLHFPVTAPHWVKNGNEVSISFSITFDTPASERRRVVYTTNARLRKLGLTPRPYGQSAWRDALKFNAYRVQRRARRLLRK